MPPRRLPALLAAAAALVLAPAAHAAETPSITSPQEGETVGQTPDFAGTATIGGPDVTLEVDGPGAFVQSLTVYGDGTWSLSGRPVAPGAYSVRACQADACSASRSFTVSGAGGGNFTAKAPVGSFRDLLDGTLAMRVHCPQDCTIAARLIVAAADARRMAFPTWHSLQEIGSETDEDSLPAGDGRLKLAPATAAARRQLRGSLAFPLFTSVLVKVELQADWGEGSFITSVTGRLRWPLPPGPHATAGPIHDLTAPARVSLGARAVRATVTLAPGRSLPRAGLRSAGALLDGPASFYRGNAPATPAQLRHGGSFTVLATWDADAAGLASAVTPLAAEVFVARGKFRARERFSVG